jgi:hypothetical protein
MQIIHYNLHKKPVLLFDKNRTKRNRRKAAAIEFTKLYNLLNTIKLSLEYEFKHFYFVSLAILLNELTL